MKITIIQGAFLPVPPILGGAVEKIWYRMGQEFARFGHEVIHISRGHSELKEKEIVAGVRYIRIRGYDTPSSIIKLKLLDLLYSIRACRQVPSDSDVVITNTFWSPFIIRGDLGKRVYVDVQRVPKGQMRYYKHVGILRACSPLIEKLIKVEFPKELASKVSYIPNPVPFDIKEFQVEKKKNVLFVGRLNKEKGVEILIDAFKKVDARVSKDWKLIIVGPSDVRDGGSGPEYLSLLKEKSIGIDVLFVGPVFDEIQLAKYYAESKIFCYPAQKGSGDAAPVAPREAMAYGCATVVSKLECFNDIIVDGVNGIQFDENPDTQVNELSDVFAELFNDPEKIDKLSVQARNVIQMYSSPIIAKQFLNDFKKLDF